MTLGEETDLGWRDRWIMGNDERWQQQALGQHRADSNRWPDGAGDDPYWVGVAHAARVATCMLREGFITRVYRTELIGSLLDVFVKLGIRHG